MLPTPQTQLIDSELVEITSFALQVLKCQQVIDRVTIIRAYAELSAMYPENARFRDEISRSLGTLSAILEGYGKVEAATRIRSWQAATTTPEFMTGMFRPSVPDGRSGEDVETPTIETILLVENKASVRNLAIGTLRNCGYTIS